MKVKMTVFGGLCRIDPWLPELSSTLTYTRREFTDGKGRYASSPKTVRETMYQVEGSAGVFPAGLLRRVHALIKARGHEVVIEDQRPLKELMPAPDFNQVCGLRERQSEFLLAVAGNSGGLLVGATGLGKSMVIVQLCRMYPTLRILVVSPRKSVVSTLGDRLREELPGQVG
jgi:predicted ATPase with chaperone activity